MDDNTSNSPTQQMLFDEDWIDEFLLQKTRTDGIILCPECNSTLTFRVPFTKRMYCTNCGHRWIRT